MKISCGWDGGRWGNDGSIQWRRQREPGIVWKESEFEEGGGNVEWGETYKEKIMRPKSSMNKEE